MGLAQAPCGWCRLLAAALGCLQRGDMARVHVRSRVHAWAPLRCRSVLLCHPPCRGFAGNGKVVPWRAAAACAAWVGDMSCETLARLPAVPAPNASVIVRRDCTPAPGSTGIVLHCLRVRAMQLCVRSMARGAHSGAHLMYGAVLARRCFQRCVCYIAALQNC